jgi:pimeloyl-ACP methyl ester carboxylesterase
MRHLGIERAHIVGHSNSGNLVLQLAMDSPEAVQSLVVAEPALMTVPSAQTARAFIGSAMQQYRTGDKAGAVDTFLKGTCGPNYRAVVDAALPGALARYAADADTFFTQQLPAMQQWSFGRDEASRITQPVLAVIGEEQRRRARVCVAGRERASCHACSLPDLWLTIDGSGRLVAHACSAISPSSVPWLELDGWLARSLPATPRGTSPAKRRCRATT